MPLPFCRCFSPKSELVSKQSQKHFGTAAALPSRIPFIIRYRLPSKSYSAGGFFIAFDPLDMVLHNVIELRLFLPTKNRPPHCLPKNSGADDYVHVDRRYAAAGHP
jgi:hypothetical protein